VGRAAEPGGQPSDPVQHCTQDPGVSTRAQLTPAQDERRPTGGRLCSRRKPRQGDRFGFGSTVTGDDTGVGRGVCTVIGTTQAPCNVQERLAKGTLSAQGLVSLSGRANKSPFTVTGGTGAYDGARGSALVTDVNSTTTDIQITLRP
jgi:hypothetical protein